MGYLFLVLPAILCLFASSTSLHDHKPRLLSDSTASKTDSLKESRLGATGAHEHDIMSSIGDDSSERSGIAHSSKFAHGSVYEGEHGGAAAGAADDTSNGGGDDHGSGAAVVTGAAMNNHTSNHRNAAGSHHANVMVLPILITTALVALVVL